ncbi:MAG: class I SAM-dependent RNA methyltransferase [Kofleriaceae bacterium]|nr:class I SAM-dependent RNA methyltransferase [Kofleriaceae bacterium]
MTGDAATGHPVGAELTLTVTSLAAGGDAVGRDDGGRVTFVPRAAPGDVVRVRVDEVHRSFARASLVAVEQPGPGRIEPACARFQAGPCGGCQWAHVDLAVQRASKHELVARALRRAIGAGLELRAMATPAPAWGWRRRARLHVAGGAVGYYAPRTHDVVDVAACPQLEPALVRALAAVRAAAPPDGELHLLAGDAGAVVVATAAAWPGAAALVGQGGVVGVVAGDGRHGAIAVELEPGLWTAADEFAQAGSAGNAAIVAEVRAALPPEPGRLLELFAGAGNLTRIALEAGWTVDACDQVRPARGLRHDRLRFAATAAERWPRAFGRQRYQAVLLDPPRAGAAAVMPTLRDQGPARVVYVSCDPATLGRDLEVLVAAGATPRWATPIDTMPHTAHVEVVAVVDLPAR